MNHQGKKIAGPLVGGPKEYTFCEHGRVRELVVCQLCCEKGLALTRECLELERKAKKRARFVSSDAKIPCEHSSEKRRCKVCRGSWICVHGKNKVYCAECDGRRLCQCCLVTVMRRCREVCVKCREREAAQKQAERTVGQRAALCI